MRLLTSTLLILGVQLSQTAYAGSANIVLECKSKTQTEPALFLTAQLPGDQEEFDLQITQAERRLNWGMDESELAIDVAMRKKKFSFELRHKNGEHIKLTALPASIKSKGNNSRLFDASFEAEFLYKAPKKDTPWPASGLLLCKANHHI